MVALMAVLVAVLALLVFVLFGIVVELCRDVRQLRELIGAIDRSHEVVLGDVAGGSPSAYGLPKAIDEESAAIVLFLHESCGTCRALAEGLNGQVPERLWLVIEARSREAATQFLERYGLSEGPSQRTVIDDGQHFANLLGLDTASVAFRVQMGTFVSASTVPSIRYLHSILPNPVRLDRQRRLSFLRG